MYYNYLIILSKTFIESITKSTVLSLLPQKFSVYLIIILFNQNNRIKTFQKYNRIS